MNILYISISKLDSINQKGIYSDLIRGLVKTEHNIYCISALEKKFKQETLLSEEGNFHHLKLKIGDITQVGFIKKGINTLTIQRKYIKAIKKYFKKVKFDLIVYATPPITFYKIVKYVKKKHNAKSYLMLKDIFPDNAVDLQVFSKKSIFYKYFRIKEKQIYNVSDVIGYTSEKNKEYILKHNPLIDEKKLEFFPNAIEPMPLEEVNDLKATKDEFKKIINIPTDKKILLYGGNIGKPQGVEFIKKCILLNERNTNIFMLIIGSGTEFNNLKLFIENNNINNTALFKGVSSNEYVKFLSLADVGLVFLDYRFNIPNFPSRILSYMEMGVPIVACTDVNTDVGQVIYDNRIGFSSESVDENKFFENVNKVLEPKIYEEYCENSRKFIENNYTSAICVDKIIKFLDK